MAATLDLDNTPRDMDYHERPGCRIARIPFDILGDILNTNAPVRIIPGNRSETKDDELWMVRCTNWPKDAVVVGCSVDFEQSRLVVKIESPDFKRDPDGWAITAFDLQYERVRVRELSSDECVELSAEKSEKERADFLYEKVQRLELSLGKLAVGLHKKESTQEELLEMAMSGFDPVIRKMYEEAFAGRPMIVRATFPPTHQYWKAE